MGEAEMGEAKEGGRGSPKLWARARWLPLSDFARDTNSNVPRVALWCRYLKGSTQKLPSCCNRCLKMFGSQPDTNFTGTELAEF